MLLRVLRNRFEIGIPGLIPYIHLLYCL
jgi:hypothetical protein